MKATIGAALFAYGYGALAMWNFMRTAYRYPEISRWYYAADAVLAVVYLALGVVLACLAASYASRSSDSERR